MPKNKNAVIRYMFLDQMLSDRYHSYTCLDLLEGVNDRLEFAGYPTIGGSRSNYDLYLKSGKRVIQLDLEALQESPFYMKIDHSERRDGAPVYRYEDQTQSLFSKPLSDDEKRLLQEVLNTLGQFSGLDNFEWLNDLQEKLNDKRAFGRGVFDNGSPSSRKIISFSSNEYLKGKDYLGSLFALISNKKVVDVDYEPFGESPRTIRLYPYLLKQYNDRWYLIGTPLETKKHPYRKEFFINLPLDRMVGIRGVDGIPYVDCDEGFEERFEDIVGVSYYEDVPLIEIVIAVEDSFLGYIETKPVHGSQTRLNAESQQRLHLDYPAFDGYVFFSLSLKPNQEFFNLIRSWGEKVILVSPFNLVREMLMTNENVGGLMKTILAKA